MGCLAEPEENMTMEEDIQDYEKILQLQQFKIKHFKDFMKKYAISQQTINYKQFNQGYEQMLKKLKSDGDFDSDSHDSNLQDKCLKMLLSSCVQSPNGNQMTIPEEETHKTEGKKYDFQKIITISILNSQSPEEEKITTLMDLYKLEKDEIIEQEDAEELITHLFTSIGYYSLIFSELNERFKDDKDVQKGYYFQVNEKVQELSQEITHDAVDRREEMTYQDEISVGDLFYELQQKGKEHKFETLFQSTSIRQLIMPFAFEDKTSNKRAKKS